ncbi:MAG: hypothetical protein KC978_13830 [Candidatus Omnitrophica bacterium]|nr:hypothetical protein [Candidatus Omnitrophota bacterium]
MLKKKDVTDAAAAFDSTRYPFGFYHHHLSVLNSAKKVTREVRVSVEELFYWRMGKVRVSKSRSQLSDTAHPTSFPDEEGNLHYASGVTGVTQRGIDIATATGILELGKAFRDGLVSFGELGAEAKVIARTSVYLPCFFIHIWKPEEWPLFEKRVWMLHRWDEGKANAFTGIPTNIERYMEYTAWFDKLVEKKKIDRWTAQVGLWELGRRLEKEVKTNPAGLNKS